MSWRDKIAAVLAGKVGGPTPSGIHVYHSSPHDFDKFDLSKLRTGEGANSYGSGFYFAESPAVSGQGGQYWQQFMGKHSPDEQSATKLLQQHEFDRAKAADDVQKHIDTMQRYIRDPANAQDALLPAYERGLPAYQRQLELLQSGAPVGPRTYEVNFRAKPEELLDWDKPLSAQPQIMERFPQLVEGAKKEAYDRALSATSKSRADQLWGMVKDPTQATGEFAYNRLAPRNYNKASEMLNEAGIPGIRYLDEGSRISSPDQIKAIRENIAHREALLADRPGDPTNTKWLAEYRDMLQRAENPTHNYVAFDPSRLDIMAKYGVVGGVPLGAATMGGTIDQSSYGARQ